MLCRNEEILPLHFFINPAGRGLIENEQKSYRMLFTRHYKTKSDREKVV